jgi:o-succinylbenzoate synthase
MYTAYFEKKVFKFKQPSGTSRGILTEKHAWFIYLQNKDYIKIGVGECSIIPGLSPDFIDFKSYEEKVNEVCNNINFYLAHLDELVHFPSILFGVEQAILSIQTDEKELFFDTAFTRKEVGISINGLIWMGSPEFMSQQIEDKLKEGYRCLKLKIGAIDFQEELNILRGIRNRFSASEIELRVDANGAFSVEDAFYKLDQLAKLDLHSIEQPIKQGQINHMAELCKKTPLPIALDEELIGIIEKETKFNLLKEIQPQYIILKPSLHGGICGSKEWIEIANKLNIPWWMTSALESNVGLNLIAQFAATYENSLPQGLGTGSLYVCNEPSRLLVQDGFIFCR